MNVPVLAMSIPVDRTSDILDPIIPTGTGGVPSLLVYPVRRSRRFTPHYFVVSVFLRHGKGIFQYWKDDAERLVRFFKRLQ
jgi:hypothetical protein